MILTHISRQTGNMDSLSNYYWCINNYVWGGEHATVMSQSMGQKMRKLPFGNTQWLSSWNKEGKRDNLDDSFECVDKCKTPKLRLLWNLETDKGTQAPYMVCQCSQLYYLSFTTSENKNRAEDTCQPLRSIFKPVFNFWHGWIDHLSYYEDLPRISF